MSNRAWVTLATNDSYGLGALVLAHSLRRAASAYPAVVLITPSVTDAMRERLRAVFAEVVMVDVLDSRDAAHLALLQRPELGITFTKIHCWSLTQYEKCVFLDADTLIIQNCDELFDREELSAAPDVGWPDCFNSGVFVYKPSSETFEQLIKFAQERGSFDGGDQGLLNSFFSDWAHGDINKHLPFLYNVTSAAFYSYLPALKHYGKNLKIIHFIGIAKPWLHQFNWESRTVSADDHLRDHLQLWWDLFVGQVHQNLDVAMVEVQLPPALPPNDVGQHYEPDVGQHYEPVVDSESEFPWHHPDAQIQEDFHKEEIDLAQFHDPWEIYRGRIPSNKEETASQHSFIGRVDDHEEMRKYAWENHPQESITQHNYQQQNHPHFEYHHHQEKHSQHHPEHPWESHAHDQSAHIHDQPSHEHIWQHEQQHQHQSQDERFVHHYHEHDKQEHNHRQTHSHEHNHTHSAPSLNDNDEYYTPHSTYSPDNHYNGHHNTDSSHTLHDHSHSQHHHDHSHNHSEHTSQKDYTYTNKESGKSHSHREEQVHHVRLDHEMILDLHKQKDDVEKPSKVAGLVNGDISESESDYYEEITPRHPYDGFYLRHIPTVDAKGRKICLHEVPPTPSPSPPSDFELLDGNSDLFLEDTAVVNDDEEQSGVAGNLARVVPGALGSQREALDELTRRQGWEAGNIDYMGADSFENIWAKISQTLSKPRGSPPKQPSPPKEQPKAPVEVAEEAASIDSAPSGAAPVTKAQAPGEAPVPVEVPAPTEAAPAALEVPAALKVAAVVETPAAVESPAPVKVPVVVESQTAVEATPQVKTAPAESATPVVEPLPVAEPEPVAAAEIPATVVAAAASAAEPLLVEPSDIPATVAAIAPGEAPQSTEAPASTDVPLSVEKASPEVKEEPAEKTETPLPPTPPVTPKSDPTTPVSESAPSVEPVVAKEEAPAPVEAPVVSATVEVQQIEAPAPVDPPVEVQKSENPAPVAAPLIPVEASEIPKPVAASETPVPVEAPKDPKPPAPVSAAPAAEAPASPEASESKPEAAPLPSDPKLVAEAPKDPEPVKTKKELPVETPKEPQPVVETKKEEAPVPVEVPKKPATPASPVLAAEAPAASPKATPSKPEATPEKASDPILSTSTDSPPLANTPSKEDAPALPAAKSEERRKAVGKLHLQPPSVADPLPTPDSELEDAASLAQSIIASELRTPTVTAPESPAQPSPSLPAQEKRLSVEGPEVPTPPVGAVSLANIGVKAKPTIAAQIESSVAEKSTEPTTPTDAPKEAPKKKLVKKVKKDSSGEAPVPPPRKKEKKPKEK